MTYQFKLIGDNCTGYTFFENNIFKQKFKERRYFYDYFISKYKFNISRKELSDLIKKCIKTDGLFALDINNNKNDNQLELQIEFLKSRNIFLENENKKIDILENKIINLNETIKKLSENNLISKIITTTQIERSNPNQSSPPLAKTYIPELQIIKKLSSLNKKYINDNDDDHNISIESIEPSIFDLSKELYKLDKIEKEIIKPIQPPFLYELNRKLYELYNQPIKTIIVNAPQEEQEQEEEEEQEEPEEQEEELIISNALEKLIVKIPKEEYILIKLSNHNIQFNTFCYKTQLDPNTDIGYLYDLDYKRIGYYTFWCDEDYPEYIKNEEGYIMNPDIHEVSEYNEERLLVYVLEETTNNTNINQDILGSYCDYKFDLDRYIYNSSRSIRDKIILQKNEKLCIDELDDKDYLEIDELRHDKKLKNISEKIIKDNNDEDLQIVIDEIDIDTDIDIFIKEYIDEYDNFSKKEKEEYNPNYKEGLINISKYYKLY